MTYLLLAIILILLLICIKQHVSKKHLRISAEKAISNQYMENKILTLQLQNQLMTNSSLKKRVSEQEDVKSEKE
ncbi:hypothetical protein CVD28_00285 [Bacillus sp. M6-12]|uniref:hypothetical protein n=1 Tax=Bacillus sp. M6-12 TaxID=2054166 RepID=UPI000C75F792|nr:hypothetical protein [Bacillus sp. M6-12]PLS18873.1 hypothetical protein CVD28_00285 [Bacillus sp. M6-12]